MSDTNRFDSGSLEKFFKQARQHLPADELMMLLDIVQFPSSNVRDRYERLALPPRAGGAVIARLESSGYIESHKIPTRTGTVRFVQLTQKGKEFCILMGIPLPSHREGSPLHEFWRVKVLEILTNLGWTVVPEHSLVNGHAVDIFATHDGIKVIVEIETGKSDVQENIRRNLDSDSNYIVCLALDDYLEFQMRLQFADASRSGRLLVVGTRHLSPKLFDSLAEGNPLPSALQLPLTLEDYLKK